MAFDVNWTCTKCGKSASALPGPVISFRISGPGAPICAACESKEERVGCLSTTFIDGSPIRCEKDDPDHEGLCHAESVEDYASGQPGEEEYDGMTDVIILWKRKGKKA